MDVSDVLDAHLGNSDDGKDEELSLRHQGGDSRDQESPSIIDASSGEQGLDAVQYFRHDGSAEGGGQQVTYRVVQVAHPEGSEHQLMAGGGLPPGTQVAHAVLNAPFSTATTDGGAGESTLSGGPGEQRFYTIPTMSSPAGVAGGAEAGDSTAVLGSSPQGQFYVMMSPSDVLSGSQRNIAPRTQFTKVEGRTNRDDRRRATHNEVERRRRDKINTWIMSLAKLIPGCSQDHNKQGQSKGIVLSKACDFITQIRKENGEYEQAVKENAAVAEQQRAEIEMLRQEVMTLQAQLEQHGIPPHSLPPS